MIITRIINSRLSKERKDEWVYERLSICKTCKYNSKNNIKESLKEKILKNLSDFLTFITFADKKDLGYCKVCTCDLYFKTQIKEENCEKEKWKS